MHTFKTIQYNVCMHIHKKNNDTGIKKIHIKQVRYIIIHVLEKIIKNNINYNFYL